MYFDVYIPNLAREVKDYLRQDSPLQVMDSGIDYDWEEEVVTDNPTDQDMDNIMNNLRYEYEEESTKFNY